VKGEKIQKHRACSGLFVYHSNKINLNNLHKVNKDRQMRQKVNPPEKASPTLAFRSDLDRIQMLRRKHGLNNQQEMIHYALDVVERDDRARAKAEREASREAA
jgi:hypothetical protein